MKVVVFAVMTTDKEAPEIAKFLREFAMDQGWVFTDSIHEATYPLKVQIL